jgi:hypothetical protein
VDFLAEARYEPTDAFVYAASLNQVEVVRRWWVSRTELLHLPVWSDISCLPLARIGKKLNVNGLDKDGSHALFMAAQNESLEVLELLLKSGASVDQQQGDVRVFFASWLEKSSFKQTSIVTGRAKLRCTLRVRGGESKLRECS